MFCNYMFQNTQHFHNEIRKISTQAFHGETEGTSTKPTDEVGNPGTPDT